MKKFIGRKEELQKLDSLYHTRGFQMAVVYGRRRIGKSTLLAEFIKDKKVLIIDDICCLGGTAYNAATQMKFKGASEVAFYISHCENGIFAGKILYREPFCPDGYGENLPWAGNYTIDKVYTADTMLLDKEHNNIHIVDAYTK